MADREEVRRLAGESIARGNPTRWFEELYRRAGRDWQRIPWADLVPNPYLVEWLHRKAVPAHGASCLVVGCGLGDDAEILARAGYSVTAFDIAPTAIETCRGRFPESGVSYVVADILTPPAEWVARFDLVFESYTLQVLPPGARDTAMRQLPRLVSRPGYLLALCRAREEAEPAGELPWPLTRRELDNFVKEGLREIFLEDLLDSETPPVRRFRGLYRRD